MKRYVGSFVLFALTMTLGEYNSKRGWTIPENEDPNTEGYMTETEEGHISWQPKELFEKNFKEDVETAMASDANRQLTYGEKICGYKLGLSDEANDLRKSFANLIDVFDAKRASAVSPERKRQCAQTITEIETAQLRALKAFFYGDN